MPKLPRVLDLAAKYLKCSGYVDEVMKLMRARMMLMLMLMLTLVLMFASMSMMMVMNMTTQALRFIEA